MNSPSLVSAHPENATSLERIVFFSDAVFAIAITLLALDIRLPEVAGLDNAELWRGLGSIYPKYLSFIVSFLVIGNFWFIHHRQFSSIERYDTRLIFINLIFLMTIAFIPFPTVVISENGNRTATIFYALTMCAAGLILTLLWFHATHNHRLTAPDLPPAIVRRGLIRNLSVSAVFLLSVALAFIDADLAKFSWLLIVPTVFLIK